MAKQKYLEAARITGTHGVKGMVRLECMTDSAEVLESIKMLYRKKSGEFIPLHMDRASSYKGALLASFREIETLEDAIPLKGVILYADRDDIPVEKGSHFIADMIGLPVIDPSIGEVGVLDDIISPAGRQIYVIKKADGGTFMIPAVPEFIHDIDTDGDEPSITVHLIDGMMD